MNDSMEEWVRTVGVRKGCLLSPTFINILIEQIKSDALVSINSRNIIKLQFAEDIESDAVAEEEQEQEAPRWKFLQNLHKV